MRQTAARLSRGLYRGMAAAMVAISIAASAQAHITGWITIDNNGAASGNTVTDGANSTVISGVEGYQVLGAFPDVTLANGQYAELNGTLQLLNRGNSAAAALEQLRDQIRFGLFRAPSGDPLQAQNLTGFIIEHRNEMREVRTPIGAPATNQAPFVSARSGLINADTQGTSTGSYSTAAPSNAVSGGNPDAATEQTEQDVVTGVNVTMTFQYRIARTGNNLNITGTVTGSPVTQNGNGDGTVFSEQFSALNYASLIDINGGTDNYDYLLNRIGFLIGGNVDYDLVPTGDYSDDDVVDAADYAIWRDGGTLLNEGATTGVNDEADFTHWRSRFGAVPGSTVLSNVTVTTGTSGGGGGINAGVPTPEPSTLGLLVIGSCALLARPRRRS